MKAHLLLVACAFALLPGCGDRASRDRASAAAAHAARAEVALAKPDFPRAIAAADLAAAYDPLEPKWRDLVIRARLTSIAVEGPAVPPDRVAELDYEAETLVERDAARAHVYKTARGTLALSRGDDAAAEALFREAVKDKPDWAPALAGLGQVLVREQKRDEAIAAFEAALKADATNPVALVNLGRLLFDAGQVDKAIETLARAVTVTDAAALRMDLGSALWGRQRVAEAGEQFQKAVALEPRNGEAHRRLAEWLMANGRPDLAEAEYGNASKLGAGPLASFGLATVLVKKGEHAQAARLFESVFQSDPRLVAAAYQAGVEHEQAGDTASARKTLERYVRAAADSQAEREHVADAQARLTRLAAPDAGPAKR